MGYDLKIDSVANPTQNKFDLYLFAGNDEDYNCFIMGAQLWTDYNVKHECDFIKMRPDIIQSQITSYTDESPTFLNHESKQSEVFAVIDNSGWLQAIENPKLTKEDPSAAGDVYF